MRLQVATNVYIVEFHVKAKDVLLTAKGLHKRLRLDSYNNPDTFYVQQHSQYIFMFPSTEYSGVAWPFWYGTHTDPNGFKINIH